MTLHVTSPYITQLGDERLRLCVPSRFYGVQALLQLILLPILFTLLGFVMGLYADLRVSHIDGDEGPGMYFFYGLSALGIVAGIVAPVITLLTAGWRGKRHAVIVDLEARTFSARSAPQRSRFVAGATRAGSTYRFEDVIRVEQASPSKWHNVQRLLVVFDNDQTLVLLPHIHPIHHGRAADITKRVADWCDAEHIIQPKPAHPAVTSLRRTYERFRNLKARLTSRWR